MRTTRLQGLSRKERHDPGQKVMEVFLEEVRVRMGCKSWKCGEDDLRKKKNEQEQAVTAEGLGPVRWYHTCWSSKEHVGHN